MRIGDVEIGGDAVVVMAGPCSVESDDQIERRPRSSPKPARKVIRGGAFKPRSSPYSFQGLGEEGLQLLREAADRHGLLVVSEVMDQTQIPLMPSTSTSSRWARATCRTSTCCANSAKQRSRCC